MSRLYSTLAKKATFFIVFPLLGLFFVPLPTLAKIPNDPGYATQEKMWAQVNAPAAWNHSVGSRKVIVAVIDTGVDTWHDDLRENIWTNRGEIPDNSIDDDRNGYVDDVNGWDFVENTNEVRTSVFNSSDDPEAVRHGTIIAGLIGASGNNERDGVGVNWAVSLMPIRAIDSSGSGSYEAVAAAVSYAVDNGAKVISMSFIGDDLVRLLRDVTRRAYDKGVVVIAAAGNHSRDANGDLDLEPLYPACFDVGDIENWILTVAAVNDVDKLSRFSNYGRCVDITAPGENIFSTERYAPQFGYQNEFGGRWQGTSFAAPLVAGAAALLKASHPDWTPDQIISFILNNAESIDARNPDYLGKIGVGRLDIGRAILAAEEFEPAKDTIDGSIYYHDKREVWRQTVRDFTALVATVPDAEIISAVPIDTASGAGEGQVVMMLKRGQSFALRVVSDTGARVMSDSVVPILPSRLVKSARAFVSNDGTFTAVIEQYDARAKKTVYTTFDQRGKKQQEIITTGAVVGWRLSSNGQSVLLVKQKARIVDIEDLPFDKNSASLKVSISGIQSVDAVARGHFWTGDSEQVALVVHHDGEIQNLVVDLQSGSYRFNRISGLGPKGPWKLLPVESYGAALQSLLPFQPGGGKFNILTGSGAFVKPVTTPKINGLID